MMTLSPRAMCHGAVCLDGDQVFAEPTLNDIDCSSGRINPISKIYNDNRGNVDLAGLGPRGIDACLEDSPSYSLLVRCRAERVGGGAWIRRPSLCPLHANPPIPGHDYATLLMTSVPGSIRPKIYSVSNFRKIDFRGIESIAKAAEKKHINYFSQFVVEDVAAGVLIPLIHGHRVDYDKCSWMGTMSGLATDTHFRYVRECARGLLKLSEEAVVDDAVIQQAREFLQEASNDWEVPGKRVADLETIKTANSRYTIQQLPAGKIISRIIELVGLDKSILDEPLTADMVGAIDQALTFSLGPSSYFPGLITAAGFQGLITAAGAPHAPWPTSTEFYNADGLSTLFCLDEFIFESRRLPRRLLPIVLRIFDQLDLEKRIYDSLMDCREICRRDFLVAYIDSRIAGTRITGDLERRKIFEGIFSAVRETAILE